MSRGTKTASAVRRARQPGGLRGLLAVGAVVAVFVLAWKALRSSADDGDGDGGQPAESASAPETPRGYSTMTGAPNDLGSIAANAHSGGGCRSPWFPLAEGARRSYRTNTGEQDGTLALSLLGVQDDTSVTRATWRAKVTQPDGTESDATAERRCEGDVAEEPWYGWGIEGILRLANQTWRYPKMLRAGLSFGGTIDLFIVEERHTVERRHRVVGRERVETRAGAFEAWRIDYDDREAKTLSGTDWVAEGPGMVRAKQDNGATQTVYELTSWSNP